MTWVRRLLHMRQLQPVYRNRSLRFRLDPGKIPDKLRKMLSRSFQSNFHVVVLSMSVALVLFTLLSACAASEAPDFVLRKIGEGVWAAIASDNGKAFANSGFVVGDGGIAVIDSFQDPESTRALLADIRSVSDLPIRFVVNTHYHIDHVNGNDVFVGAAIVAHRNVRTWMRSENLKFWPDPPPVDIKARVQSLRLPDVVFDDGVDLYLGSRKIEVRHYPGHTGSDSVVIVPDARVVFCGDLLWKDHFPNLIDATTESWISTLAKLGSDYASATFVPGHGGLATASDVAFLRQYFGELRDAISHAQKAGKSGDALVDAVLPALQAKYGNWAFFDDYARDDIRQTADELSGHKRLPKPLSTADQH